MIRNNPNFTLIRTSKKISNNAKIVSKEIKAEETIFIDGDSTHLGVLNGRYILVMSSYNLNHLGEKWKFFRIPAKNNQRMSFARIPDYSKNAGGHYYGKVLFFETSEEARIFGVLECEQKQHYLIK